MFAFEAIWYECKTLRIGLTSVMFTKKKRHHCRANGNYMYHFTNNDNMTREQKRKKIHSHVIFSANVWPSTFNRHCTIKRGVCVCATYPATTQRCRLFQVSHCLSLPSTPLFCSLPSCICRSLLLSQLKNGYIISSMLSLEYMP